jgi:hypothetical protein
MLFDRPTGELLLEGPIRRGQQRSGVAGRELSLGDHALDGRGQLEEADGVGHGGSALADPGRHLFVGQAEVLDQPLEGRGLLEGREVLPLDVLDQCLLCDAAVVGPADDGFFNDTPTPAIYTERYPPTLHDALPIFGLAHENRLEDSQRPDRGGQLAQRLLVELRPGLTRVGGDRGHRHLAQGIVDPVGVVGPGRDQ